MTVTVHLHEGDTAASCHVLATPSGRFLSLRFGGDLTILIAGYDAHCADAARALAAALIAGADQLDVAAPTTEVA